MRDTISDLLGTTPDGAPVKEGELAPSTTETAQAPLETPDEEAQGFLEGLVGDAEKRGFRFKEGAKTPGEMFASLTPAQKAQYLETAHVSTPTAVGADHPFWIDEKAKPPNVMLAWFHPGVIEVVGTRGFRKVPRTATTMKWVPNCDQADPGQFIGFAGYTLYAISADVELERILKAHRKTTGYLTEADERFRSAIASARGSLGLSKEKAEALDRAGRGIIAIRGLDPTVAQMIQAGEKPERDTVKGEGEE